MLCRVAPFFIAIPLLAAAPGSGEPDLSGRYAAFDVLKAAEADRLLSEATEAGFRVRDLRSGFRTRWTVVGYAALLERSEAGEPPVAYELVIRNKVDWLQDGLNETAMQGYRMRPGMFFFQRRGAQPFQDPEFVALMERSAERTQSHYLVLAGEELGEPLVLAARRGYEVVGFAAARDVPAAVLEIAFRAAEAAEPLEEPYRLLEGGRRSIRRRLQTAAAEGYRLIGAASPGGDHFFLLRKHSETVEYRFPPGKDLLEAVNEAAAEGYRVLPFAWDGSPVMERAKGEEGGYAYELVGEPGDEDVGAWARVLEEAVDSGARIVRLTAPRQVLVERSNP